MEKEGEEKFLLCKSIGHRPLWGRCPKKTAKCSSDQVFKLKKIFYELWTLKSYSFLWNYLQRKKNMFPNSMSNWSCINDRIDQLSPGSATKNLTNWHMNKRVTNLLTQVKIWCAKTLCLFYKWHSNHPQTTPPVTLFPTPPHPIPTSNLRPIFFAP